MNELHTWAKLLGGEVCGEQVLCPGPGHSPKDRSLSVTIGKGGQPVTHSFCGDDPIACKDYVRTKLGQPEFKPNGHAKPAKKTFFDYHDAHGALVYQVERTDFSDGRKKAFNQRRADPDRPRQWITGKGCMAGVQPLPYRLPELLEALAHGRMIVLVEGEAKADLLWKLGIPATCNSGGYGSVKNWADHAKYFKAGNQIVIAPDNDQAGCDHANTVAAHLTERGVSVRILDLPGLPPKGDVIDWAAAGGTREQLDDLIENTARPWAAEARSNGEDPVDNADARAPKKPPSRVIGAGTFMRSYEPISYTLNGIIPSGYLYGITAKQGSGKTALMIAAALAVASGRDDILGCAVERGRVAYVTIENPVDFKMKLAVNCFVNNISYDEVETRIAIIDGRDTPEQIFEGLRLDAGVNGGFQLVCFDTYQAGFAAANAGAFNDNEAMLGYLIRLRPLTTLPGLPSALMAFHPTKNAGETELIPYGGGSTINEVDGNLTLWKEGTIKLHHNRLRGPEFEPRFFRIEQLSCPDIVDKGGRQILLPVLRPTSEKDVEERARVSRNTKLKLLRAMLAEPKGTQRDWAMKINLSVSTVNEKLKILEGEKLVKKILDAWFLTPNGENLAKS